MRPRCAGALIAHLVLLLAISSGPAAAERTGTPRLPGGINYDPWLWNFPPVVAPGNTLVLGSWNFGTPPSCTDGGWTSVDLTAGDANFGDYAGLFSGRDQHTSDQCMDNLSCLWAFINGSTDDMTCAGRASQMVVPYGDAQRGYIWNEVQSPPIDLAGTGSSFGMRFAVYRGLPFHTLVFYTWRVRSLHGGIPGEWKHGEFCYYAPTVEHADWLFQDESIGALIEPGADQIQLALGVIDMAGVWAGLLGDGACHRNSPLFDSVKVYRVSTGGPQWLVDFADLFQDNFAGNGTVTGTVRMDMARDINPRDVNSIHPGDSLVVTVNESTVGLDVDAGGGPAVYLHVRDVSPEKSGGNISDNLGRWRHVGGSGGWTTLQFDSVRTASGVVPGRYCVDLNDDLYTPGDSVVFYFSARDAAGRTTYWSEFIGTTTFAADVLEMPMEATCLPTTNRDDLGILFVDDADGGGAQVYFEGAFQILGIGASVDRYDVRGPHELAGNGPGSRVRNVDAQLANYYHSILWTSAALTAGTIGDGTGAPEKSPDAAMLAEFIEKKVSMGVVYLAGDQVAAELARLTSSSAAALRSYIQYDLIAATHSPLTGVISPSVRAAPGSVFVHQGVPDSYNLFGGCPHLNSFCLLGPSGPSVTEMLYGNTSHAEEVSQWNSGKYVLISGAGFEFIRDDELDGISDRARHLGDMLHAGDIIICSGNNGSIDAEDAGAKFTWHAGNCTRTIRIVRTAPWAGRDEVIHTAAVPPETGTFHDRIPYGQTAWYRIEAQDRYGSSVIKSAVITRDVAITDFSATSNDLGIRVAWSIEDRTGMESLSVQRRVAGGGVFAAASDDSLLPPSATHFVDTHFTPGASYEYRLAMRYTGGPVVYGEPAHVDAPDALTLGQNAPNPFNPATRIPFLMPTAGAVEVTIFNVNGQRVRAVWSGAKSAGYTEVEWDGRTDSGAPASSGIYFCRLRALGQTLTRKIVLVR